MASQSTVPCAPTITCNNTSSAWKSFKEYTKTLDTNYYYSSHCHSDRIDNTSDKQHQRRLKSIQILCCNNSKTCSRSHHTVLGLFGLHNKHRFARAQHESDGPCVLRKDKARSHELQAAAAGTPRSNKKRQATTQYIESTIIDPTDRTRPLLQ